MEKSLDNAQTPVLLLSTAPDEAVAQRIAEVLVGEQLAACVNILPGLTSVYRWKGEVQKDSELLLLIKTRSGLTPAVLERLTKLHPYEVPEAVVFPILDGHPPYLRWIFEATQSRLEHA